MSCLLLYIMLKLKTVTVDRKHTVFDGPHIRLLIGWKLEIGRLVRKYRKYPKPEILSGLICQLTESTKCPILPILRSACSSLLFLVNFNFAVNVIITVSLSILLLALKYLINREIKSNNAVSLSQLCFRICPPHACAGIHRVGTAREAM